MEGPTLEEIFIHLFFKTNSMLSLLKSLLLHSFTQSSNGAFGYLGLKMDVVDSSDCLHLSSNV